MPDEEWGICWSVDTERTNLEVATIECTVGVDDHEGKVPAEDVLVIGLYVCQSDSVHI